MALISHDEVPVHQDTLTPEDEDDSDYAESMDLDPSDDPAGTTSEGSAEDEPHEVPWLAAGGERIGGDVQPGRAPDWLDEPEVEREEGEQEQEEQGQEEQEAAVNTGEESGVDEVEQETPEDSGSEPGSDADEEEVRAYIASYLDAEAARTLWETRKSSLLSSSRLLI